MPLISICIPVYNGSKYLRDCLESVINQSFKAFEVVLIDDGSSDNSVEIIREFQQKDARFHLYQNKENLGLVGNWNECIKKAKGDWVKFLFQDDLLHDDCIEKFAGQINDQVRLIGADREFIFHEGTEEEKLKGYLKHRKFLKNLYGNSIPQYFSKEQCQTNILNTIRRVEFLRMENLYGEPTSIMIKKEIFEELDWFNERIIHMCDLEYCNRIAVNHGFTFIPDALSKFRVHGGAATSLNHTAKSFRMHYHDPIEILQSFMTDGYYEKIRDQARRAGINLQKLLTHYLARLLLMVWVRKKYDAEWEEMLDKYQFHEQVKNIGFLLKAQIFLRMIKAKLLNYIS